MKKLKTVFSKGKGKDEKEKGDGEKEGNESSPIKSKSEGSSSEERAVVTRTPKTGVKMEHGKGDAGGCKEGLYPQSQLDQEKQKLKTRAAEDWKSSSKVVSAEVETTNNEKLWDETGIQNLNLSGASFERQSSGVQIDTQQSITGDVHSVHFDLRPTSASSKPPSSSFTAQSTLGTETQVTYVHNLDQDVRPTPKPRLHANDVAGFFNSSMHRDQESLNVTTARAGERKVEDMISASGYSIDEIVRAIQFLDQQKQAVGNPWQSIGTKFVTPAVLAPNANMENVQTGMVGERQQRSVGDSAHSLEHLGAWGYSPGNNAEGQVRRVVCSSEDERFKHFIKKPKEKSPPLPTKSKSKSDASSTKIKGKKTKTRHGSDSSDSDSEEDDHAAAAEKARKKKKKKDKEKSTTDTRGKQKKKTGKQGSKEKSEQRPPPPMITEIRKLGSLGRYKKLDLKSDEFKLVSKYCKNSHNLKDSEASVKINSIYEVSTDERESKKNGSSGTSWSIPFLSGTGSPVNAKVSPSTSKGSKNPPNIKLLFFKTNDRSVKKLAERDDGSVAFYDRVARAFASDPKGLTQPLRQFIVLCSVNLGSVRVSKGGYDKWLNKRPSGFDSVQGVGRLIPDSNCKNDVIDGRISVPVGKTVKNTKYEQFELDYNEYVVYEAKRIKVKYAVDIEIIPVVEESDEEESTSEESESSDDKDKKKKSRKR